MFDDEDLGRFEAFARQEFSQYIPAARARRRRRAALFTLAAACCVAVGWFGHALMA
ncbi:hypothetical protein [Pararhodospirillum photometricum]|uniref:hypothetical protein n=1 Tax=Pararhodospirillum photometricum TaxID=1084 RepID=UPI0002DD3ED4|nr:hypothetical protein [Pararhodospirillum photometricum]